MGEKWSFWPKYFSLLHNSEILVNILEIYDDPSGRPCKMVTWSLSTIFKTAISKWSITDLMAVHDAKYNKGKG